MLNKGEDEVISQRRKARKEEAKRKADKAVTISPEVIKGNVHERPSLSTKKVKAPRKKHSFKTIALLFVLFAGVTAYVVVTGLKLTNLQLQKRDAEKQLEALTEKTDSLQQELQELDSDEYVENAARSELHMIKDGEVMYIVNPNLDEASENADENTVKTK